MLFFRLGLFGFFNLTVFTLQLSKTWQYIVSILYGRGSGLFLLFFWLSCRVVNVHIFDLIFKTLHILLLLNYQSVVFSDFSWLEMDIIVVAFAFAWVLIAFSVVRWGSLVFLGYFWFYLVNFFATQLSDLFDDAILFWAPPLFSFMMIFQVEINFVRRSAFLPLSVIIFTLPIVGFLVDED